MPVLKVLVARADNAPVVAQGELIEAYDAFTVLRVSDAAARKLARQWPVEDISGQYRLPLGGAELDPLAAAAAAAAGPAAAALEGGAAAGGLSPTARRALRAAQKGPADGAQHHHLVQFVGPVKDEWLKALKKAGALLRHPTPGFGQVVRADAATLAAIRALPFVRWAGHLPHADRVAPAIGGNAGPAASSGTPLLRRRSLPGALQVLAFDADALPALAEAAKGLGFEVVATSRAACSLTLASAAGGAELRQKVQALSAVHGVRWIGEKHLPRTSNQVAAGILNQPFATRRPPGLGLSGEGEVVAVCDTGLDTGDAATVHADFAGRVVAIKSYPIPRSWSAWAVNAGADDGAADLDTGHGTHVAGSVLGDGSASAGGPVRIQGTAPKARLVFQAVEQEVRWRPGQAPPGNPRYLLAGIPDDLGPLLRDAYEAGARIHSNSWGGGDAGAYDEQCRQVDDFVWRRKDFCVVIAAGNDGSDADGDGVVNPGSVTSPGTCKNGITVGASENQRPEFNGQTYGGWWPADFPAPPLRADPMANNPKQMAAFSSRGPTLDGRVKPDVVAPGTFVLSTRSSRLAPNNFAWGAYPPNHRYFHMGGTSMATPLVSGCLALLREHLRKAHGLASPSAALLKALLIAGAARLPGLAPQGSVQDNAQGYGRVNLERCLRWLKLVHEGEGLATGQMHRQTLQLNGARRTLRVALAYTDFPGAGLINNLNLIITGPTGRRWLGNQRNGSGVLQLDGRNNAELVQVSDAANGSWTIDVVASNVSRGPQDFALAVVQV